MANHKTHTVKWPHDIGDNIVILLSEMDRLIDEDYDYLVIVTPKGTYVSTIDDWLDFGHFDVSGDVEVRVLPRSYFGRA